MAQYGKNYYGASYYGISGVFAGQFTSDRTLLHDPIKSDGVNTDGTVNLDIYASIPRSTYKYDNNVIIINDNTKWTDNGTSISTSDSTAMMKVYLTSSDVDLNFIQRADGAAVQVDLVEYDSISEVSRVSYFIDTTTAATLSIPNLPMSNYIMEVKIDPNNLGGVLEFDNVSALTGDISLEFNHTTVDVEMETNWSGFEKVTLTRVFVEGDTYKFSGTTSNIVGAVGYQFKILMATADNESTPEVSSLDLYTPNNDNYAEDGYWKVLVDLGADFDPALGDSLDSVTYSATTEEDSVVEVLTRTTEDTAAETQEDANISWGYWSAPYSNATQRIILDMQNVDLEAIEIEDPAALAELENGYITGHITSPLLDPENITHWLEWIPEYYIVDKNPVTEELYNTSIFENLYIDIEFLNADFTSITVNNDIQKYRIKEQHYNISEIKEGLDNAINKIQGPLRVKIKYYIKPGHATPAFDSMSLKSEAYYRETKVFLDFNKAENDGKTGFEGYGCAVFGDNSGIDFIYTDGRTRNNIASITNLGFTIPSGAGFPRYTVEQPDLDERKSNLVNLFWQSEIENDDPNSTTEVQNDRLMVETIENGLDIRKYRHRGSGITLKIEDGATNYDTYNLSNVFYPVLNQENMDNNLYGYYLSNGYDTVNTINNKVDIRWAHENGLSEMPEVTELPWNYRRYISLYPQQDINVSIVSAGAGTITTWSSQEIIRSGIANINSPTLNIEDEDPKPTVIEIDAEKLPDIDASVILTDDNPYKIEVVDGTVTSEEQRKNNNRINIDILGVEYQTAESIEYDAKIVKNSSSRDFLFRTNTTEVVTINKEEGTYLSSGLINYKEGIHFSIVDGMIDWSLGINDPLISNSSLPEVGDDLYVTYKYYKPEKIYVRYGSNYNRKYYDRANIYRTPAIKYIGRCSSGVDYVSEEYDVEALWPSVPNSVDKETLKLKVKVTDNDFVNAYIEDDRVVGSLGFVNPKENWHPHIKDGFYNIGKSNYYLFTSPKNILLDKTTVPSAENIDYKEGSIGSGLLIQESTANIFTNTKFQLDSDLLTQVFTETFER